MKIIITTLFYAVFSLTGYSQDTTKTKPTSILQVGAAKGTVLKFTNRNSIQLDAFGHGLFYSFNYERIFLNRDKFKTGGQVGISYYPPQIGIIGLWIPISINQLISFNKHHIEFGIGHVIAKDYIFDSRQSTFSIKTWNTFGTFKIGYRFQNPKGRYLFKITFTPFIEYYKDYSNKLNTEFYPSGGLTFGYSF